MRQGKVSQAVLDRSVIRQIGTDTLAEAYKPDSVENLVFSTGPATGIYSDVCKYALSRACNDVAAKFGEPIGVTVSAIYPPETQEQVIASDAKSLGELLRARNLQLFGGHTEVTDAVSRPLITITAIGRADKALHRAKEGDTLILTESIALEAVSILAELRQDALEAHFPKFLCAEAKAFGEKLSIVQAAQIAGRYASAMQDLSQGGIFGSLWEFAEQSGIGLEVDLKAIPIRQETVEICDYLGVNPYESLSSGSLLFSTDNEQDALRALHEAGIEACVIGRVSASNDRIIRSGEEIRYLDRPKADEMFSIFAQSV